MQRVIPGISWAWVVMAGAMLAAPALAADSQIVGRWDIALGDGPAPCWLGVELKDGKYAARFLQVAGSVSDLKEFKFENPTVEFKTGDNVWTGKVEGDAITGKVVKKGQQDKWTAKHFVPKASLAGVWTLEGQDKATLRLRQNGDQVAGRLAQGAGQATRITDGKLDGYKLQFTAGEKKCAATVKGDLMEGTLGDAKFTAKCERQWGEPIELFNGKDLAGWKPLGNPNNFKWKVADGITHCDGHGSSNIVTEKTFEDFKLHVEFKVPQGGNSGVYLFAGAIEIQVADSAGRKPGEHDCGSLYSRIAPSENACKPAGEWQTYDITLVDHYVTVVQNGKTIIDNQDVQGITGGAIDSNETQPGPIYLQGDHTAIDYRKVTLTPVTAPTAGGRRAKAAE